MKIKGLLVCLMFWVVFGVGFVCGAIYNSTEGTTVYECGNITEAGDYSLNQSFNTTLTCIRIQADNVILNFSGYNITGEDIEDTYGVYSDGYNESTIKNGEIYDFWNGISLRNNQNNNITNMTANSNNWVGIYLKWDSNNNQIINNTANSNGFYGIRLDSSSNNTLTNNTANSNIRGGFMFTISQTTIKS